LDSRLAKLSTSIETKLINSTSTKKDQNDLRSANNDIFKVVSFHTKIEVLKWRSSKGKFTRSGYQPYMKVKENHIKFIFGCNLMQQNTGIWATFSVFSWSSDNCQKSRHFSVFIVANFRHIVAKKVPESLADFSRFLPFFLENCQI
jgi:hypothetical protein